MPQNSLTPDSYMAQQGQGGSSNGSALTPDSYMAHQAGADSPAQPGAKPSSDPSQPGMISRAWNWMTTPFGVVDRATDSDEVARQKIQAIGDRAAMQTKPGEEFPWWKTFAKEAAAGTARDVARTLGSPMGVVGAVTGPLAAGGEAGEVPAIISRAARVTQAATSAPFIGTGAHHVYQGVKEMVPESMGGGGQGFWTPEVTQKILGGAAEMAGGAAGVMSAVRPPKLHFTEDQIKSLDHDAARGVQKHLSDFATKERAEAGADIANDDAQLDHAYPTGVVDGQEIFQNVNPLRKELFPAGGRPEPRVLSRVEAAASASQGKSAIPQNVLNDFLDRGVITPEDTTRTWSASDARKIEGDLWAEARRYSRAKDFRSAKAVTTLASQIHDARQAAAESINIGDEFNQHNARYSQYMNTFENGPVAKVLQGKNADAVLNPFVGPNGENIRRQLEAYADQVNVKGLHDVAEFHGKVRDAFAPGNASMKNRLITSAGMMAIGMGIGHPFLGLIGASMAGRQAIGTALARGEVAGQAEHLPIEPLTEKYSLPMPERGVVAGKVARGMVTAGTPAANETASSYVSSPYALFLQAANASQSKPGKYGVPQFVHQQTGQRVRHDGKGGYQDVDSGEMLPWRWTGGTQ